MAERSHWWTERWLRSPLFLSLSLSFSLFLSLSLSFSLFLWLSTYLPTYLPIDLSTYLSIHPSIYLSISLSVCLSICLSASLKTKQFSVTSSVFELDNIKNAEIQRDFLNFCIWQRQKRSNSARLPHFLSWQWQHQKAKQFCKTSYLL